MCLIQDLNSFCIFVFVYSEANNIFEAISIGAVSVIGNIGAIIANLIAFIAFFAFVNDVSIWFFSLLNIENFGVTVEFSCDIVFNFI